MNKVLELAKEDEEFITMQMLKVSTPQGDQLVETISCIDWVIWGRSFKKLADIINTTPDGYIDNRNSTLYKWTGSYWAKTDGIPQSKTTQLANNLHKDLGAPILDKGKFLVNCRKAFNSSVKNAFKSSTTDEVIRNSLFTTVEQKSKNFDPKRSGSTANLFFGDGVLTFFITNGQAQEIWDIPDKNNYNNSVIDCKYSALEDDSPPDVISLLDDFERISFTPGGTEERDTGMAARFWEVIGLLLTKGLTPQIMVWFWGDAGTGKSFIYEEIIAPLVKGTGHFETINENDLTDKHGMAYKYDARVLYYPDAAKLHNQTIDKLKSLTGDGELSVNKKFGDIETKLANVIPIIVTNNVPTDRDESGAAADRMVILRFTGQDLSAFRHHFTDIQKKYPEQLKQEIIKRALEGLRRYYAGICSGKYRAKALSPSIQDVEIHQDIDEGNSSLIEWFCENYIITDCKEDFVSNADIKQHFTSVRNNQEFKHTTGDIITTLRNYIINRCKKPKWDSQKDRKNGKRGLRYICRSKGTTSYSEAFKNFQKNSERTLEA